MDNSATTGTPTSAKHNPVLKYSVVCPMCGTTSFQYRINPRLFWNEKQDIDLQPRNFQSVKGLEYHHPPLWDYWHCPQCHYAANYKHFSEPLKDVHMRIDVVQTKFRESSQSDAVFKQVLAKLGTDMDTTSMDFFRAIKLNLLAIYVFELIERLLKQNFIILAKYYLHLAWTYRDLNERPEEKSRWDTALKDLTAAVRDYWPDIPADESAALNKAEHYYHLALGDVTTTKSAVDEINVIQMMGRIHIKLGSYRRAQEMLMSSIDRAHKAKVAIDQRLKLPPTHIDSPSEQERGEVITQSRKLESLTGEAQNLLDSIKDKVLEDQRSRASDIVKMMTGKTPDEIRKTLQQQGIDNRIIQEVTPEPEKKKGLFGFLK